MIFSNWRVAAHCLRFGTGAVAITIVLEGCGSTSPPLAIRMYNPSTNQTLHCTGRSQSSEHSAVLAKAVEACAQQLEAKGFVRD